MNSVDSTQLVAELKALVTTGRVLNDPDSLQQYGCDWTKQWQPNPVAIVLPKNIDELQSVVLWANKEKVALVPSGGRTGLSGGAVA